MVASSIRISISVMIRLLSLGRPGGWQRPDRPALMRGRSMCSRAPQNRITRPCSTTRRCLRVHPELEAELGAALAEEAEQQAGDDDADRVVTAIRATAMPVKPKPSTKLS